MHFFIPPRTTTTPPLPRSHARPLRVPKPADCNLCCEVSREGGGGGDGEEEGGMEGKRGRGGAGRPSI